jgi:hypothetical protein
MINKLEILQSHIDNIQFHIDHVNKVLLDPTQYGTPENKQPIDLDVYMSDLLSQKEALINEKIALTN